MTCSVFNRRKPPRFRPALTICSAWNLAFLLMSRSGSVNRQLGVCQWPPPRKRPPSVRTTTLVNTQTESGLFNFLMTFHVHEIARAEHGIRSLVAPFESNRQNWDTLQAFDRKSEAAFRLQTKDPHVAFPGLIPVQTYGDYFDEYRVHPELKLADADGRSCHPWSRGALLPRHVRASAVVRIGKTSERVSETQTSHAEAERAVVYGEPRLCPGCEEKVLTDRRARYCGPACKQRAYRRRIRARPALAEISPDREVRPPRGHS